MLMVDLWSVEEYIEKFVNGSEGKSKEVVVFVPSRKKEELVYESVLGVFPNAKVVFLSSKREVANYSNEEEVNSVYGEMREKIEEFSAEADVNDVYLVASGPTTMTLWAYALLRDEGFNVKLLIWENKVGGYVVAEREVDRLKIY